MTRSARIEAEVSDPVEIARRLWGLAGAPPSLLSGSVPPELRPWSDCAHAAFEDLVAALRPERVRVALGGALDAPAVRKAGPEKSLELCSRRLLGASSEAYLAATVVRGLAATLSDPSLAGVLSVAPPLLSWAPGPAGDSKPGMPLVYEAITLS